MEQNTQSKGKWLYCKRCKKKLIKRLPNGLFVFEFGKRRGDINSPPRVHIEIHGDAKIRCLNPDCLLDNIFNMLPVSPRLSNNQPSSEKGKEVS